MKNPPSQNTISFTGALAKVETTAAELDAIREEINQ